MIQHGSHAIRELTLEALRSAEFPAAISRLRANFAFPSVADAALYEPSDEAEEELWEVEIPEGTPITRADPRWLATPKPNTPAHWLVVGRRYWSGEPGQPDNPMWELVVGGPVRLVARVER